MQMKRYIGIAILLLSLGGGIAYKFFGEMGAKQITVKGLIGSEKQGFFENPEIKELLQKRYGISVEYAKAGSIAMVSGDVTKEDFLFPSSQVALELFKNTHPDVKIKSETIFNSPIIMYSWDIVADALEKEGIVKKINDTYYIVAFKKLIELILSGAKWEDIGLSALYGKVHVIPTDPTKSNSGNQFAALLANMLNDGEVIQEENLEEIMPTLKEFFQKIGYMERSTGYLFEQFLTTGVGSKPIIVGYESQIIEYCAEHKENCENIKKRVRILYPEPTLWSSHILISLSEKGTRLLEALQDPEIQEIAWKENGFRSGLVGIKNDPNSLLIGGIPSEITKVMPMPSITVMDKIVQHLQQ